jgi:predicted GNAT family N-acyltransferase
MINPVTVIKVVDEADLPNVYAIRRTVFIDEQQVPAEEEFDRYEKESEHFLAYYDGVPCGAARWRETTGGTAAKLERFAVLKEFRGKGVGSALVEKVLTDVLAQKKYTRVYLNAQLAAIALYEKFGFTQVGEEFLECDIRHMQMELRV